MDTASLQGTDDSKSRTSSDASGREAETGRIVSTYEAHRHQGALKLEQLDVGDCRITDQGIQSLARLVQADTRIDNLCLTGNRSIGEAGWRAFGRALRDNSIIKTCSMDYAAMGDKGVIGLLEGAEGNKTLRSLDFEGNMIGDDGGQKILEFVRKHPTLNDVVMMPGNHISQTLVDQIKQVLSQRE